MTEWTDATIQRLRELWAEGVSTPEIGRRLGMSKNAVVGKAHRLDLPGRPSPILPTGPRTPEKRREAALKKRDEALGVAPKAAPRQPFAGKTLKPLPSLDGSPCAPPPQLRYGRLIKCCWPIGEPGTRNFRFCDAASVPGRPYCEEHAALAYIKVRSVAA